MEHLIESVRKYPCLWNVALRDYKDIELKEAAWQKVTKDCDLPNVKETKTLWKKLRDGFRQATSNKKRTTSGQAANSIQKWKYEDQMEFLLPTFKNRPTQTNISTQVLNESIMSTNVDQQTASDSGNDSPQPQKKRHKSIINILENDQKRREKRSVERDILRRQILESNLQNENPKNTAMEKFGIGKMSMCYTTNELPAFLQIRVKKKLFNIVTEAQEQHLMQSSSNVIPENTDFHNISATSLSLSPVRADSPKSLRWNSACSNYLNSYSNTSHSPVHHVNSPQSSPQSPPQSPLQSPPESPPPRLSEARTSMRPRNTVKTQLIRQFRSLEQIATSSATPGSPEHVYLQQSSPQNTTPIRLYPLDQHELISGQDNVHVDINPEHKVDSLQNPPPRLSTSMAPRNNVTTQLTHRFRSPEQRAVASADLGAPERRVLSQQSILRSSSSSTLVSPQNTNPNQMYHLEQHGPKTEIQLMRQLRPFKHRAAGSADTRSPGSSYLVSPQSTTPDHRNQLISEHNTEDYSFISEFDF